MCVGAGETEAADRDPRRPPRRVERRRRVGDPHRQRAPIDARVERAVRRLRRQHPVREGEHRLGQPGGAGRRLEMTDIRLDRAQQERRIGGPAGAVGVAERHHLDRVAERCRRAVALDRVDLRRSDPGIGERGGDHFALGAAVRCGEPVAAAVLVDRRAADHRQHGVAVAPGVVEPAQHQHRGALAADIAIGLLGEGAAEAARAQHAEPGEGDGQLGFEQEPDAAGERHVAFAGAQAAAGEMRRDQRRRAGGVDDEARAGEVEHVGEPAGERAVGGAGGHARVDRRWVAGDEAALVVVGADAEEHAGRARTPLAQRIAGAFQRLPGDLGGEALLRVHRRRLGRRDAEEPGVEPVDRADKAAPARHPVRRQRGGVPALRRHLGDRHLAVAEEPPEPVRGVGTGQAQRQADNRNRHLDAPAQRIDPALQTIDEPDQLVRRHPAEPFGERVAHPPAPRCSCSRRLSNSSTSRPVDPAAATVGWGEAAGAASVARWASSRFGVA